ncbi:hypothetical protein KC19_2G253700 [Ceratodon purpureus]|uniref:Uncharacterized protein n=1 Tax=Ceratodon purpureus TaxID=3225 RepID=A0A8T0J0N3_CERPU|nr:hypothetical protein KC19_2G253700 [Ceratodon purpureus]
MCRRKRSRETPTGGARIRCGEIRLDATHVYLNWKLRWRHVSTKRMRSRHPNAQPPPQAHHPRVLLVKFVAWQLLELICLARALSNHAQKTLSLQFGCAPCWASRPKVSLPVAPFRFLCEPQGVS